MGDLIIKPTLHEIAAMPYPSSVRAMRKHYEPHWGKPVPEGGEKRLFEVTVEWSARGHETYEVEAFTEDEAEDLAEIEFDKDCGGTIPWDAEWEDATVKPRTPAIPNQETDHG